MLREVVAIFLADVVAMDLVNAVDLVAKALALFRADAERMIARDLDRVNILCRDVPIGSRKYGSCFIC